MHWEQKSRDWRTVRETDVPAELVDKLDGVRADLDGEGDRLDYCRLRRPPRNDEVANSRYLKWDNLLEVEPTSTFAIALELASAAAYLVEYERSDPRFEVQVSYVKGGKKDSKSITFTLGDLRDDDDDDDDDENDDDVVGTAPSFVTGTEKMTQLASSDPLSFALLMQQQAATMAIQAIERSNKATVKHAIRLLKAEQRRNERTESAERHRIEKLLQHVLSNQETIQSTIFSGAGKLADIGLSFHAKAMEREQAMAGMAADAKKSETMAAMFGDGVKVAGDVAKTMFASAMQAKVATARGAPGASSGPSPTDSATPTGSPPTSTPPTPPTATPPTGAGQIPKDVQLVGLARRLAEVVTKEDLEHVKKLAPKVAEALQQLTATAEIEDVNRVLMAFADVSFNQLTALSEGLCQQTSDVVGAFLAVWSS